MYLSLLYLNPASRDVQCDLRDVQNLHCRIMTAFPDMIDPEVKARTRFGVLHRLEFSRNSGWHLYVQSRIEPDWNTLPERYLLPADLPNPLVKEVGEAYCKIRYGRILRFRLRANPTKKIDTMSTDGKRRNGRRVPLNNPEEQVEWLVRKANRHGFKLGQVIISSSGSAELVKSPSTAKTFQGVVYEGTLQVNDEELFLDSICSGIGPGKAYGFGLLSIAPK